MNIEDFRDYCIWKGGVTESFPFDDDTLVFNVCGKMFALCSLSEFENGIALKCAPEKAVELREKYAQVQPGYHMNKAHWNTILPAAGLPDELLKHWINESYDLVVAKLTKAQRLALM